MNCRASKTSTAWTSPLSPRTACRPVPSSWNAPRAAIRASVRGIPRTLARIAALGAFQLEGTGRQAVLGDKGDVHAVLVFDARQFMALLVQDVDRHIVGDLDRDRGGAVFLSFFL